MCLSLSFYTILFIYTITNFFRFAIVVLTMYKENITKANDIIKEESEKREELIGILKQIRDLHDNKEKSDEQLKKAQEDAKIEKENAPEIPDK